MTEQTPSRLALIGEDGFVENVIEAPPGSGPEFAVEVLGMPGNWVLDPFVHAGVGSLYVEEVNEFYAIDIPEEPTE